MGALCPVADDEMLSRIFHDFSLQVAARLPLYTATEEELIRGLKMCSSFLISIRPEKRRWARIRRKTVNYWLNSAT